MSTEGKSQQKTNKVKPRFLAKVGEILSHCKISKDKMRVLWAWLQTKPGLITLAVVLFSISLIAALNPVDGELTDLQSWGNRIGGAHNVPDKVWGIWNFVFFLLPTAGYILIVTYFIGSLVVKNHNKEQAEAEVEADAQAKAEQISKEYQLKMEEIEAEKKKQEAEKANADLLINIEKAKEAEAKAREAEAKAQEAEDKLKEKLMNTNLEVLKATNEMLKNFVQYKKTSQKSQEK